MKKRRRRRLDRQEAATAWRRQAVPLELYAGDLLNQQRRLALYGPLARELGEKLQALRESRELSITAAAKGIGVHTQVYRQLEAGAIIMSPEMQRRVILFFFKNRNWQDTPTMPALRPHEIVFVPKEAKRVQITWFDAALWGRTRDFALKNGVSMSAVVAVALERFLLDEPALVTIEAALRVAEKLRTESILAANPDLVYILKGDPQVAKLAALAKEAPAEHQPTLKDWNPLWQGAATPIAADELRARMLAPRGEDDE